MLCVVKQFEKREDENRELPYYVIRATGTVGDVNATSAFNDDGTINVMAMQSRVYNFTKTMFPATRELCDSLESGMPVDDDNNVTEERKINLMLYQWDTGKSFISLTGMANIIRTKKKSKKRATARRELTVKLFQKDKSIRQLS